LILLFLFCPAVVKIPGAGVKSIVWRDERFNWCFIAINKCFADQDGVAALQQNRDTLSTEKTCLEGLQ